MSQAAGRSEQASSIRNRHSLKFQGMPFMSCKMFKFYTGNIIVTFVTLFSPDMPAEDYLEKGAWSHWEEDATIVWVQHISERVQEPCQK